MCIYVSIMFVASRAALGACNGAVGFSVLQAAYLEVPQGFTLTNTVIANTVGATIIGLGQTALIGCLLAGEGSDYDDSTPSFDECAITELLGVAVFLTAYNTVVGCVDSIVGAQIMGIGPEPVCTNKYYNYQVRSRNGDITHYEGYQTVCDDSIKNDFASWVGASGGAITILSIFVPLILLRLSYLALRNCDLTKIPTLRNCDLTKIPTLSIGKQKSILTAFKSYNTKSEIPVVDMNDSSSVDITPTPKASKLSLGIV